jgi:cerevisin
MFNPLLLLSLLSSTLALPTPHQQERRSLAPLRRAESIPRAIPSSSNAFIVSLKPGSVDPSARGDWLASVLDGTSTPSSASLAPTSTSTTNNTVKASESHHDHRASNHGHKRAEANGYVLGWDERVFNGLAGTFTDSELDTLRARDEVAYIQQGLSSLSRSRLQDLTNPTRHPSSHHFPSNANKRTMGNLSHFFYKRPSI